MTTVTNVTTTTKRRGLCDFFELPHLHDLIERLSSAETVTLVVGAGSSIEVGFPDWETLVRRMLAQVAGRHRLEGVDRDRFVDWTIRGDSITGAAAVAKAELQDAFLPALHGALYEQRLTPTPGATARAAAKLLLMKAEVGDSRLATTNYDLVLEAALAESSGLARNAIASAVTPTHGGDRTRSVLHLHGALTPRGLERGTVVLSEQDYHRMQQPEAWQEQFFDDRLAVSTCLFVGTSLTDPNLLRYLYRARQGNTHIAVFVRQQAARLYDETSPLVARARERTATSRWAAVGVDPVQADFYTQSAQLLYEIVHYGQVRAAGGVYRRFPDRMQAWHRKLRSGVFRTSPRAFDEVQDGLHATLRSVIEGIRDDLERAGHTPLRDERFGMSLWLYDPTEEALTNWASSDRVWRDPSTLVPIPVDWRSDFIAVQAFCSGSLVSRSTTQHLMSRWNHVVGAPLYLDDDEYGRLPVGVVTLASTEPAPRSALARGLSTLRQASLPTTEEVLSRLFHPGPGPARS